MISTTLTLIDPPVGLELVFSPTYLPPLTAVKSDVMVESETQPVIVIVTIVPVASNPVYRANHIPADVHESDARSIEKLVIVIFEFNYTILIALINPDAVFDATSEYPIRFTVALFCETVIILADCNRIGGVVQGTEFTPSSTVLSPLSNATLQNTRLAAFVYRISPIAIHTPFERLTLPIIVAIPLTLTSVENHEKTIWPIPEVFEFNTKPKDIQRGSLLSVVSNSTHCSYCKHCG